MYDLLIKNGTIIDGSGKERFAGDVVVDGDKIKKIGNFRGAKAKTVIDALGLYVCPGFVDVLSHSDTFLTLLTIPTQKSLVHQGITTIIGGNCGSSLAPLSSPSSLTAVQKWSDIAKMNVNWLKVSEFLDFLEKKKIGVNFGMLVGHGTLRRNILKDEFRDMNYSEFEVMKWMLEEALEEGAFGFSSGLVYSHENIASTESIISLMRLVSEYNGVYATHIRSEATGFLSAINEAIMVGRESGAAVEISHLKVVDKRHWDDMSKALKMIESAEESGVEVGFSVYPYDSTASVLYIFLPDWVAEGGRKAMLKRLKDSSNIKRVIEEMKILRYGIEYDKLIVASVGGDKMYVGQSIQDIADNMQITPEEAIMKLLLANHGKVTVFTHSQDQKNVEEELKHRLSLVVSDGAGYTEEFNKSQELVHPRSFGAFPKILGKYVREKKLLTLEEAIYKMTFSPAKRFRIKQRGFIDKKYFADIVVFDPKTIADVSDFVNPYRYARGIEHVVLNGKVVLEKGEYKENLAGQVLRRK